MIVLDANVLVYAHRADAPCHEKYFDWLESLLKGREAFGVVYLVLGSFLRLATHPRIFNGPSTFLEANAFLQPILQNPKCEILLPGPRHWEIFVSLCKKLKAKGNLIPDVYLASIVIESGDILATADKDFEHFPDLRWIHP